LSCCRCHDHKTDPLSQADHYRLRAFFAGLKAGDDLILNQQTEEAEITAHNAAVDAQVAQLQQQRDKLQQPIVDRLRATRRQQLPAADRMLLASASDGLTEAEQARRQELVQSLQPSAADVEAALGEDLRQQVEALQQAVAAAEAGKRPYLRGWLTTDQTGELPPTHVFYQGDHQSPRETVAPGFLSIFDAADATLATAVRPGAPARRTTLAAWITAPENPLTARVLVNRLWQLHFGRGLVATPNDFGFAGARPSHPELLDWLASEVVQQGWSLKALQRQIVLSATYRQTSSRAQNAAPDPREIDRDNIHLWRQHPRRLTAEQLRDALLVVSGLWQPTIGGPAVWPELPAEVLQANPAFLDDNAEKTKGWYPSPADQQSVRSLYLIQKRTVRVPWMETFDLPDNTVSCARRTTSTVAPQALSLLNNPLAVDAAEALAEHVTAVAGSIVDAQINAAFAAVLQRAPQPAERQACQRFLESQPLPALCRALLNLSEFVWLD
jgi:hypothetical protein